jgi:hypothetical protein
VFVSLNLVSGSAVMGFAAQLYLNFLIQGEKFIQS